MIFNPLTVFSAVSQSYEDYVKSTFYIEDIDFRMQFNAQVEEKKFTKGPIIECTDSFLAGESISELIHSGILNAGFSRILTKTTDLDRNLYRHQIDAIVKTNQDKNIVVTTGTGSGKTECFLYPILNSLLNEIDKKTLHPGVRALLLYPMNALANDQVKRLRDLLCNVPEITFGAYTGETKESDAEAIRNYQDLYEERPLSNEIISRQAMKTNPPHILLTNYAMLEYLLLRPKDNVFFDGGYSDSWKYIVLDEAHTYRGASGIEISYLMRRLYNRLEKRDKIRFILTSATLGESNKNNEIIEFARNISAGVNFEPEDIIRAKRKEWNPIQKSGMHIDILRYKSLLSYLDSLDAIEFADMDKIRAITDIHNFSGVPIREFLYELISHDPLYVQIREYLQTECSDLDTIASFFKIDPEHISSFLTIAGMAQKNSLKLVDLRYHAFIRSLEGVYVTFSPDKTLTLMPRKMHHTPDGDFNCYKLSVCQFCGQMYLEGNKTGMVFGQPDAYRNSIYMILDDESLLSIQNISDDDDRISKLYSLCTKCNTMSEYTGIKKNANCRCKDDYAILVKEVKYSEEDAVLHSCERCKGTNSRGSILRGFYIGSNAASSIIGASIFENIPYKTPEGTRPKKSLMGHKHIESKKERTKRLLVFSDNRQDAAFFAAYLQSTYTNLLKRRLLLKTVRELAPKYPLFGIPLTKVAVELARNFELDKINNSSSNRNDFDPDREAWKSLLYEIQTGDRNGLVNLDFLQFTFKSSFNDGAEPFSETELKNIDELLMASFLRSGAVSLPVKMTPSDYKEVLFQSFPATFVREKDPSDKNSIKSNYWLGKHNIRTELLQKTGRFVHKEEINNFLSLYWDGKVDASQSDDKILSHTETGFQLLPEHIFVRVSGVHDYAHVRCSVCGKVSQINIFNKCLQNRCNGELHKVEESELKTYQKLNLEKEHVFGMVVKEHTAQLGHKKAAEYQKEFVSGKTHVLSCSTTFEMGVDVGDLEAVFMRNMPPTPANYIQRAGRAGRRLESTAFALTFCKLGSHDFMFFNNPEKMVKGVVSPPNFKMTNDKIAMRHVYSALLGNFWRKYPDVNMIGEFFTDNTFKDYLSYLNGSLDKVINYILEFTSGLYNEAEVREFIDEYKKDDGLLLKNHAQYLNDLSLVDQLISDKSERREFSGIQHLEKAKNTMASQNIISFFSRNNLIPKYGFPIDTVELYTNLGTLANNHYGSGDLKLQRDMSMAISEYAPGSEIIANGMIYKSAYIKPAPVKTRTWRQFIFAVCDDEICRHLNIQPYFEEEIHASTSKVCGKCGKKIQYDNIFILPDYGFIASTENPERASTRPPVTTSRSKTFYLDRSDLQYAQVRIYQTNNGKVKVIRKENDEFTVLNQQKYFVCHSCGFSTPAEKSKGFLPYQNKEHRNSFGYGCANKKLIPKSLGHIFKTDAVAITFDTVPGSDDYSILYSLLEGMSRYFDIERSDINGTLSYSDNEQNKRVVYYIFYDTVPGGAGHTKRVSETSNEAFLEFLVECYHVVANCSCGDNGNGEAACYSCLCNYRNQLFHEQLNRTRAKLFLYPFINDKLTILEREAVVPDSVITT